VLLADTWPRLFRLGWPVSATLLVRITMRTVDILVVGWVVGAAGVAALGIGDAFARLVLFTGLGLGAGTIATVSQHVGAGRPEEADVAVTQTAMLALAVGVPFAVLGWFAAPAAFGLLGASGQVAELGATYLRVVMLSAPARTMTIMLTRAFQGAGDTTTPLKIRGGGTLVNIALTVLLVPGLAGLPELGVLGAAVGTVVGNVGTAVVLLAAVVRGWRGLHLRLDAVGRVDVMRRIAAIGWPQVVERNLFALGTLPLNAIALAFGTAANAGLQVGQRLMLYGLLPSRGVATAASSIAGNQLGAGNRPGADRIARGGLSLSVALAVPVSVVLLVFAQPLARVFVSEPDALAAATGWVRVYAGAVLLRSVYGVLRGSFQAGGLTRPPLLASATGVFGFMVGASWLLGVGLGLGLAGVFVGVLLDPLVRTAMLYRRFRTGEWQVVLDPEPADRERVAAPAGGA
jgi:MATE family multidrug resistance protein